MKQGKDIHRYRREAVDWMIRLTPGAATNEDIAAFKQWCSQDTAHANAFVETRRLWDAVGPAGEKVAAQGDLEDWALAPDRQSVQLGRRAFLGGALAASAAAAGYAVIYPPLSLWPSISEWTADYRTATGEQRQIALANDIAIEMNTQTSITLRQVAEGIDRIELITGEGLVKAKSHALEVAAAGGNVRAADAMFNIRRDGDKVSVTCLEGEVLVGCQSGSIKLASRRRVSYSDAGLGPVAETDSAAVTSWREGFLAFHDARLSDVIVEINRYRRGRIIVVSEALAERPVNGRFYLTRLDEVVDKFRNAFGARVTSLPGGIVILS